METDASKQHPRMAEAIEARRKAEGLSPGRFAEAAGVTPQGLIPVRNGELREYSEKTTLGVARALRWPTDWYDRIQNGTDPCDLPTVEHADDSDPVAVAIRELSARIEGLERLIRQADSPSGDS